MAFRSKYSFLVGSGYFNSEPEFGTAVVGFRFAAFNCCSSVCTFLANHRNLFHTGVASKLFFYAL